MLSINQRPKVLSEIIEQDIVVKQLKNKSRNLDFSTYMIFYGHSGSGKSSCAFIIAKLLNCMKPVQNGEGYYDPCNECDSCSSINEMRFGRDIHYLDASRMGINEIRDLERKLRYCSMYDSNRIFIIDEAHLLSQDRTKGAMLTMAERPRKNTYLILCTTSFEGFNLAFRSRFTCYPFYPISYEAIHRNICNVLVKKNIKILDEHKKEFKNDVMPMIAIHSKGSVRQSLEYLDNCLSGEFCTRREVKKALNIKE